MVNKVSNPFAQAARKRPQATLTDVNETVLHKRFLSFGFDTEYRSRNPGCGPAKVYYDETSYPSLALDRPG